MNYDNDIGVFDRIGWHCKGGGGGSSTTTTQPSPEQRAVLNKQLALATGLERKGELQFFPGQTLADESALTGAGQQQQLGTLGQLGGLTPEMLAGLNRSFGADQQFDPRTLALADAATRPIEEQFYENTLPAISSAATSQGAFGGDRANLLRADAAGEATQAMGDVRAGIFERARLAGVQEKLSALGMFPEFQQGLLAQGQAVEGIGARQEDRSQAEIEADRERFEFEQFAPTDLVNRVNAPLSGINFGSVTTTSGSGGGK
jgi:hypothetical protein